jgi:ketosteroid isomerase-like protein
MERQFAMIAVLLVCCGTSFVIGQTVNAKSSAEDEMRAAMAERTKAALNGDIKTIESGMAENYLQTDIFGRVQSKSEWLEAYAKPLAELIKTHKFRWNVYDEKEVAVRAFGDTAIIVGILTLKGKGASIVPGRGWVASPESTMGPIVIHFTRVWVKRDGKWLLAALHNATVPEQTKN